MYSIYLNHVESVINQLTLNSALEESLLPPKLQRRGLYLNGSWLLWSVNDGLL